MNRMGTPTLCAAFTAAALMISTGCQSTGNATPPITRTEPAPAAPEIAVSPEVPAAIVPELETVYFEYNRWNLREDAQRALRSNARQLQASPEQKVLTVEGHCDERGSEEYNLALGDRRASAVKRYLVDLGVPASRVRTLSFGEGRPAVAGEGEAAWSRNRRAELSLDIQQASR